MADPITTTQQSLNMRVGSDLSFPFSNNFVAITGVPLIVQDIQIALLTLPGERVFDPTFGCTIRNQIWENIDTAASAGLSSIRDCLNTFEPRINLLSVDIIEKNRNTDLIIYRIQFLIKNTDTTVNLVFPMRTAVDIASS